MKLRWLAPLVKWTKPSANQASALKQWQSDVALKFSPLQDQNDGADVGLKTVPMIVTGVPIGPELGAKPVRAAVGAPTVRYRLIGSGRFRRAR
jgi:hypothetical protein